MWGRKSRVVAVEKKKICSSIPAIFLYTAMMNQSPEVAREFWHPLTAIIIYCEESWVERRKNPINIFCLFVNVIGET